MDKNYSIPLFLLFFGVGLIMATWNSLKDSQAFKQEILSSQDYPIAVALILVILAIVSLITIKNSRKTDGNEKNQAGEETKPMDKSIKKKTIYVMISSLIFVLGVTSLGYFVSTFFFVAFLIFLLKDWKELLFSITFSLIMTTFLYIMFNVMGVYFPNTMLF